VHFPDFFDGFFEYECVFGVVGVLKDVVEVVNG